MKLLALDTATDWCSVALWQDGEIASREARAERGHGGQVLTLIDALLAEAGIALGALDALAFGRGPGAFTGLRLAASVTQGLAFAAGLPVIPVSDLRALAQQLPLPPHQDARVLVCHDARMGEVYWGGFRSHGGHAHADTPERVAAPKDMIDAAIAWLGTLSARSFVGTESSACSSITLAMGLPPPCHRNRRCPSMCATMWRGRRARLDPTHELRLRCHRFVMHSR